LQDEIAALQRDIATFDPTIPGDQAVIDRLQAEIDKRKELIALYQQGDSGAGQSAPAASISGGGAGATAAPAEDWQHQASANLTPLDTWYFKDQETEAAKARGEEMVAAEDEYWNNLFALRQEHADAEIELNEGVREAIEDNERRKWSALSTISQQGGLALMTLAKGHSKAVFRLGQAVSIAQATISGYQAAVDAWKFGMSVGGPPVAAAFTGLSLATTGAYIASIASQKFTAREKGGPVSAGESYIVGERGPEILTMGGSSGYITNNEDAFGGGGDTSYSISLIVQALDARSVERLMRDNPEAVTGPLIEALQRGDSRLIGNMRRAM
jgi:hypothetical protein